MDLFSLLGTYKIVAIIRGLPCEKVIKTTHALRNGGIKFVEVTFNQTEPENITSNIIAELCKIFPDMYIGAGTVMTMDQLYTAYHAGAKYIITPNTDKEIIKEAKKLNMLTMPGAMTPSEIVSCYNAGADVVKIFPADNLGIPFINAVRGPLGHIPISAVGGVNLDNIREFFANGVYCVGIGSNIIDKHAIEKNDYIRIEKLARQYVNKLGSHV